MNPDKNIGTGRKIKPPDEIDKTVAAHGGWPNAFTA
jgi:hypothetical protein